MYLYIHWYGVTDRYMTLSICEGSSVLRERGKRSFSCFQWFRVWTLSMDRFRSTSGWKGEWKSDHYVHEEDGSEG